MLNLVFLATSSIIGLVLSITLVAITIAICLYLFSLKQKEEAGDDEDSPDDSVAY